MLIRSTVIAALFTFTALPLQANEMGDVMEDLCEKIKTCALEQISSGDLTPEMRQMMEPMLENMCLSMRGQIAEVSKGHPLQVPAMACMRSMQALNCDAFQNGEKIKTPECDAYEKAADAAGEQP